jgi:hypothetical protein
VAANSFCKTKFNLEIMDFSFETKTKAQWIKIIDLIHIFKEGFLCEVVPSLLDFVLTFFKLNIRDDLLKLSQRNCPYKLIAKKIINKKWFSLSISIDL